MASIIQLKTGTGSAVPTSLAQGEVAINIDNGLFYFGSGSGEDVKSLDTFTNITASNNISASGTIIAPTINATNYFDSTSTYHLLAVDGTTLRIGQDNITSNISAVPLNVLGHITALGNISASGQIIGSTGSFAQTVITLESGAEESPFIITIADNNGQDNKLEVTKDGVLKFGALDTLPTAITGGLVYSSSAFYMGF